MSKPPLRPAAPIDVELAEPEPEGMTEIEKEGKKTEGSKTPSDKVVARGLGRGIAQNGSV
jgi:hypothetical protein